MNNETLTKCICHKGFSGYSSIVARSNFRVGGQDTAPQSLTAHTLDRYGQVKETTYRYETDKRTTRINFDDKPKNLTKEWRPATTKKTGRN